jgi:DNA-binding transcriptional LysR family regulator
MDINLARTFLEIVRTGSFIAASQNLHVTQTTVTARIHSLESLLGCRLFIRNKGGAKLSDNGKRFVMYASQLVESWDAARRDLPLPSGTERIITIGGEISLWNPLLLSWMKELREQKPELALRVEVDEPASLHQKLERGVMSAAIVHLPEYWMGMQVEQICEEKLVMVRSVKSAEPYVLIDWGEEFIAQHHAALPQLSRAGLSVNLGPLALPYLLENGGSGYFRTRVVQSYLDEGSLERVKDVPEFSYPVYVVYPRNQDRELMDDLLPILKTVVEKEFDWSQRFSWDK